MRAGGFKRWECVFFSLFLCIPSVSSVSSSVDSLSNRWKGGKPRRVQCCCCCCCCCCFCRRFFIYFISSFGGPLASCSCPSASPCFFLAFFSSCSSPASSRNGMNGWRMGGGLKNEIKKKHTRTHTHTQQTRNEGSAATWGPAGEWTKRRMKRWRKEKRKSVKRKKNQVTHTKR